MIARGEHELDMADLLHFNPEDPRYPTALLHGYAPDARPPLVARGNLELIEGPLLALFCSIKCPGRLILQTYDLARVLREAGVTVVSGFHSPMERECLALLLRGAQPVVICPARSIDGMRLPLEWRDPLTSERILLLSAFDQTADRATAARAAARNKLVAALATQILVLHAARGSRTDEFCRGLLNRGRSVLTLDAPENAPLISSGARPVTAGGVATHVGSR